MTLNEYQEQAMTTCMESSNNVAYMFFNLMGEVGELIEKVNNYTNENDLEEMADMLSTYSVEAKRIRKEPEDFHSRGTVKMFDKHVESLKTDKDLQKECGDILWQLAGLCSVMGWSLEDIAQQNLDKLADRQQRNQIDGDGDER